MNQAQFLGILRALLPALMAYAVGRGWVSESSAGEVTAAIVTLAAAGWSLAVHTDSNKLAEVEAMPAVKKILVDPAAPSGDAASDAAVDRDRPKVSVDMPKPAPPAAASSPKDKP